MNLSIKKSVTTGEALKGSQKYSHDIENTAISSADRFFKGCKRKPKTRRRKN